MNIFDEEDADSLSTINKVDRKAILAHLEDISKLPENWDSLGANNISDICIKNTRKIILGLYHSIASPEIYPNPNGTITLDWEADEQLLSIEIGDTRYSSYWEIGDDTKMDAGIFNGKMPRFFTWL
ncbi:MAG: hypothetical protein GY862_01030 [Gammaproteobacteria bacterium]|nr:hypothetical protein [Gammaproteobacteria bacterium]